MVHLLCACRPGLQFVSTLDLPHPAAPCMPVAALPYVEALFTLCLFRRALWLQVALRKVGAQPGWLGGRVFPLPAVGVVLSLVSALPACALACWRLDHLSQPSPPPTPRPQILKKYDKQKGGQRGRAFLQQCWRMPAGGAFLHSPLLDGAPPWLSFARGAMVLMCCASCILTCSGHAHALGSHHLVPRGGPPPSRHCM